MLAGRRDALLRVRIITPGDLPHGHVDLGDQAG